VNLADAEYSDCGFHSNTRLYGLLSFQPLVDFFDPKTVFRVGRFQLLKLFKFLERCREIVLLPAHRRERVPGGKIFGSSSRALFKAWRAWANRLAAAQAWPRFAQ